MVLKYYVGEKAPVLIWIAAQYLPFLKRGGQQYSFKVSWGEKFMTLRH